MDRFFYLGFEVMFHKSGCQYAVFKIITHTDLFEELEGKTTLASYMLCHETGLVKINVKAAFFCLNY